MRKRRKSGSCSSGELSISYDMAILDRTIQIEEQCRIGHKQVKPHAEAVREYNLRKHPETDVDLVKCGDYYIELDAFLDHLSEVYLRALKFYPRDKLKEMDVDQAAKLIMGIVPDMTDPEELPLRYHYLDDIDD